VPDRNATFLNCGVLLPLQQVVPFDSLTLDTTPGELTARYNKADFALSATSGLSGNHAVLGEIDGACHKGKAGPDGMYTPEKEHEKNLGHFALPGFSKTLLIRINPAGEYTTPTGKVDINSKARWLVARDWMVTFLRSPWGTWKFGDKTLVYLFYDFDSILIDRSPEFTTVVAYQAPALPAHAEGAVPLADYACTLDPYLLMQGSEHAQTHLALADRFPQPE
jgi:hypothetical protein